MKKIWILPILFLLIYCKAICRIEQPSILNPDGIEMRGCGSIAKTTYLLLALAASSPKVKIKAPSSSGFFKIQIQSRNLNLSPEQISESILLTPEKGIYKISNADSVLFQKEDFDFSGPIIDGIIIRKEGKI
ncbi:MAG TPA: hypothetical protein PKK05_27670, partial [Leptospiraceae bacterium]|nr:hypothetical protein [Leptospiraceae bacterium]